MMKTVVYIVAVSTAMAMVVLLGLVAWYGQTEQTGPVDFQNIPPDAMEYLEAAQRICGEGGFNDVAATINFLQAAILLGRARSAGEAIMSVVIEANPSGETEGAAIKRKEIVG
ncbi:MAG: hypothetical protein ABII82_13260 [Verrucomicrobiota bacterium]